jgi:hypothetical protein
VNFSRVLPTSPANTNTNGIRNVDTLIPYIL